MPSWLFLITIVTVLFAINPIFNNGGVQIHGPAIQMLVNSVVYTILVLIWLLFFRWEDVYLATNKSLGFGVASGVISFIAVAALFSAYQIAYNDLTPITIVVSFSVVVLAIINHFLGDKLMFHQWIGAIITFLG